MVMQGPNQSAAGVGRNRTCAFVLDRAHGVWAAGTGGRGTDIDVVVRLVAAGEKR